MKTLLLFLFLPLAFFADDAKEAYKALYASLSQIRSISGQVETMYFKKAAAKSYKTEKGSFRMQEGKACVSYAGTTIISNGKHRLSVDDQKKIMMLNYTTDAALLKEMYGNLPQISDSLIDKSITIGYATSAGGKKILQLVPKNKTQYEKIEIETDDAGTFFKRISYYFRQVDDGAPGRIDILYSAIELNMVIDEKQFSLAKYATISAGACKPAKAYEGYDIVDYRKQK